MERIIPAIKTFLNESFHRSGTHDFQIGVRLCIESLIKILQDPLIRKQMIRIVGLTILLMVLTHLLIFLLLIPIRIVFTIFYLILSPIISFPPLLVGLLSYVSPSFSVFNMFSSTAADNNATILDNAGVNTTAVLEEFLPENVSVGLTGWINWTILSLPFVLLLFIRYVWWTPLDNLFQRGLKIADAEFASQVYSLTPISYWVSARRFLGRFARRLMISLCLLILSYVPVIGPFVFPCAQFYLTARSLGFGLASAIFLGSMLPGVNGYSRMFYEHFSVCLNLSRELMEPYLCRVNPSANQKAETFKAKSALLLGFMTPFALLHKFPFIGPLSFGIAQAAMAFLVVQLFV